MVNIKTDDQGYLIDFNSWDKDTAIIIASSEGITLNESHWEIIEQLRLFYKTFNDTPSMRPLTKWLNKNISKEKSSSIYLYKLFPNGPAIQGCKIAGLPKPAHCL